MRRTLIECKIELVRESESSDLFTLAVEEAEMTGKCWSFFG